MGLFSLFRRKNKNKKTEEIFVPTEVSTESDNTAATSEIENTVALSTEEEKVEPTLKAKRVTTTPKATPKTKKTIQKTTIEEPQISKPTSAPTSTADDFDTDSADKLNTETSTKKVKLQGFGGAFEIKKSKDGRFVFNLYAANRVIVATSQIYSSSQSAITGINSVIANAEKAAIEDQTLKAFVPQSFPKWEIYIDKAGQFRFRLLATNGSCVCHSQGYTQKSTCKKGIESIIRTVKSAEIDKAYLKKNKDE